MTEPQPGQRWQFEHGGINWDVEIDRLQLDGDIVHAKLVAALGWPYGSVGDLVIVPTASVRAGKQVRDGQV